MEEIEVSFRNIHLETVIFFKLKKKLAMNLPQYAVSH